MNSIGETPGIPSPYGETTVGASSGVTIQASDEIAIPSAKTPSEAVQLESLVLSSEVEQTTRSVTTIHSLREVMSEMRLQVGEMVAQGTDMEKVMQLTTAVYKREMVEILHMAQANLSAQGIECPIGDRWCVIGVGSMGRDDVSPYSDLDFAVLVEENTNEVQVYFEKLFTEMSQVLVDFGDKGMHLCTGGLAPKYESFKGSTELLGTPSEMADFVLLQSLGRQPPIGTKAYALLQASPITGDRNLMTSFLEKQSSEASAQPLKYPHLTPNQNQGIEILSEGMEFWNEKQTIQYLERTAGNSAADTFAPAHCNIKRAILRPIQNSVLGLCRYHGIQETHVIRGLRALCEKGVIKADLADDLIDVYKKTFAMRLEIELQKDAPTPNVTRFPEHMISKHAKAKALSDGEYSEILASDAVLDRLSEVVDEYIP